MPGMQQVFKYYQPNVQIAEYNHAEYLAEGVFRSWSTFTSFSKNLVSMKCRVWPKNTSVHYDILTSKYIMNDFISRHF